MGLLDYFNLNKQLVRGQEEQELIGSRFLEGLEMTTDSPDDPIEKVISSATHVAIQAAEDIGFPTAAFLSVMKQLVLYGFLFLGVFFSSAFQQYTANKPVTMTFSVLQFVFSAFIAVILMPLIYGKLIRPDAPFTMQIGLALQQGLFYSALFGTVGKQFT